MRANELGVDVIVTDHHLPEDDLPPALAVINPNRTDCSYPNPNLCGAGVAFKLAHAILAGAGWPAARLYRVLESFLKLVAIATVADIVPLTGENRVIVKHGLERAGRCAQSGPARVAECRRVSRTASPMRARSGSASRPRSMPRDAWTARGRPCGCS